MDEVVTEFSMEKLMTMPKGAWREFASPMKARTGTSYYRPSGLV